MNGHNVAMTAGTVVATVASVLAGLMIWLLVTQPASMATAVGSRDATPLFRAIVGIISEAFASLIRYL